MNVVKGSKQNGAEIAAPVGSSASGGGRSRSGFPGGEKAFLLRVAAMMVATVTLSSAADSGIPSDYEVVHANVAMRHGQRSRLVKSNFAEFGSADGVALTAEGEKECYDIGQQLRNRYMNATLNVTTEIQGMSSLYDADRFQIVSSGYDRTLECASSLLLSLYPAESTDEDVQTSTLLWKDFIVVPIHSSDPENDPTILASDKCPVYIDNWLEFYQTDEFLEKQEEASDWIIEVRRVFKAAYDTTAPECWVEVEALYENKLELHAPYNLWDCINVYDGEDQEHPMDFVDVASPPTPSPAETGFEYLTELVDWLEDQKFEQSITGRMVGGLWITGMLERMDEVVTHLREGGTETSGRFPGMHVTLGHSSTLKGIAGALDIGGLDGIPPYASHFSFELLWNSSADVGVGEEDFGVRIMYQGGTETADLEFLQMNPIFDADNSLDIDDALASKRDSTTGIMGWTQFRYLMDHQIEGGPAYYSEGEEEWCTDCSATNPDTCLRLELEKVTEEMESAQVEVANLVDAKEAVDDGVKGHHVALLSIFGVVLGIGIGICIKPFLDRFVTKKAQADARAFGGEHGLSSWPTSTGTRNGTSNGIGNGNGSFRLGAKPAPTRHVLGGASGQRGGSARAMPIPTTDPEDVESNGTELVTSASRIPEFAPTSVLGEPVPFPHRRQSSSKMTGVDRDHGDYDPAQKESSTRELLNY